MASDIDALLPERARVGKQQWCAWAAYDGARFSGVQVQPGRASVLAALRARLAAIGAGPPWALSAASRTDAGVHARANLLSWRQAAAADVAEQQAALVAPTADGLTLVAPRPLPRRALARCMAASKRYRYVLLRPGDPPRADAWALDGALDLRAMRAAAAKLVGRHDFAALRARGCGQQDTVRTLFALAVVEWDAAVAVELHGDAFLRRMARRIVGLLVAVGRGECTVAAAAPARPAAAATAPAHGLTLIEVVPQTPWGALIGRAPG